MTPLSEVYKACMELVWLGGKEVRVYYDLEGEDNTIRAGHFAEEKYIQIGQYKKTAFAFQEGIYSWGYPSSPNLATEISALSKVFNHHALHWWFNDLLGVPTKVRLRNTPEAQESKDLAPILEEITFDYCQDGVLTFCMHFGVLEIPDHYLSEDVKLICSCLDVLWEEWLYKFHKVPIHNPGGRRREGLRRQPALPPPEKLLPEAG